MRRPHRRTCKITGSFVDRAAFLLLDLLSVNNTCGSFVPVTVRCGGVRHVEFCALSFCHDVQRAQMPLEIVEAGSSEDGAVVIAGEE